MDKCLPPLAPVYYPGRKVHICDCGQQVIYLEGWGEWSHVPSLDDRKAE